MSSLLLSLRSVEMIILLRSSKIQLDAQRGIEPFSLACEVFSGQGV